MSNLGFHKAVEAEGMVALQTKQLVTVTWLKKCAKQLTTSVGKQSGQIIIL